MKLSFSKKDLSVLSAIIKYLACILSVVFVVRGVVQKFSLDKNGSHRNESTTDSDLSKLQQNSEVANDLNWVDQLMNVPDRKEIPTVQISNPEDFVFDDEIPAFNLRMDFIKCAKNYLGTPYKYGGTDENGMDCSGFVYASAKESGLGTVEKSSSGLKKSTYTIERENALPGDLVFFDRDSTIYHVAIYLGDNKIIHSISDGSVTGVAVSSLDEPYWAEHLNGFGRLKELM